MEELVSPFEGHSLHHHSPIMIYFKYYVNMYHRFSGMDPIAKRFMWEVISRISTRRGKTAVILTTHSMDEAQALCTRIGIMVPNLLCSLDA